MEKHTCQFAKHSGKREREKCHWRCISSQVQEEIWKSKWQKLWRKDRVCERERKKKSEKELFLMMMMMMMIFN